jgi:hypothetical protein
LFGEIPNLVRVRIGAGAAAKGAAFFGGLVKEKNMQDDKPTLIAYTVKDPRGVGQKGIWTRIGAAWPHENGSGYSIHLDALPVDGRIVLVGPTEAKLGGSHVGKGDEYDRNDRYQRSQLPAAG